MLFFFPQRENKSTFVFLAQGASAAAQLITPPSILHLEQIFAALMQFGCCRFSWLTVNCVNSVNCVNCKPAKRPNWLGLPVWLEVQQPFYHQFLVWFIHAKTSAGDQTPDTPPRSAVTVLLGRDDDDEAPVLLPPPPLHLKHRLQCTTKSHVPAFTNTGIKATNSCKPRPTTHTRPMLWI